MKVCVIGNSHIVALKLAWDRFSSQADGVELRFFGSSGQNLRFLKLDKGALTSDDREVVQQMKVTSGGSSRIEIADYDAFLLSGLSLGVYNMLRLAKDHRTVGTVGVAPYSHLISDAVFDLAVKRHFALATCVQVTDLIRSVAPNAPIAAAPTPHPCRGLTDARNHWADAELLSTRIEPVWSRELAEFLATRRVSFVPQRKETQDGRFFTQKRYSVGSVSLRGMKERVKEEHRHMNAEYGSYVLADALPMIGAPAGAAARIAAAAAA
jgi:hypothetical protein